MKWNKMRYKGGMYDKTGEWVFKRCGVALFFLLLLGATVITAAEMPLPLFEVTNAAADISLKSDVNISLSLNPSALAQLTTQKSASSYEFILPQPHGKATAIHFTPFEVLARGGQVVSWDGVSETPIFPSSMRCYRGINQENSQQSAFMSVSDAGELRVVLMNSGETTALIEPDCYAKDATAYILRAAKPWPEEREFCGSELMPSKPMVEPLTAVALPKGDSSLPPLLEVQLLVDVEHRLLQERFEGNVQRAVDYVTQLFGAVSAIYQRDIRVVVTIKNLVVWTIPSPFECPHIGDAIDAYMDYNRRHRRNMQRAAAYLLGSDSAISGGLAYVRVACNTSYGYGVCGLQGDLTSFPTTGYEWDIEVVTHELGHNLGSIHTHCYEPPIDCCYASECPCTQVVQQGTVMSYCHFTEGGIDMHFHPRVAAVIRDVVSSATCVRSYQPDTSEIDSINPGVVSLNPPDNTDNVSCDTDLMIAFSEPVYLSSWGQIVLRDAATNATVAWFTASSANLQLEGNILTLRLEEPLTENTNYYVTIFPGFVHDAAENLYEGITDTFSWNFSTTSSADEGEDNTPPLNDFCSNAIPIAVGETALGTTEYATGYTVSSCSSGDYIDVWYVYTPLSDGEATFDLCASYFDTSLSIYDACGGNELACNDDACGYQSRVSLHVEQGLSYYVRVAGFGGKKGRYALLLLQTDALNPEGEEPQGLHIIQQPRDTCLYPGMSAALEIAVAGFSGSLYYSWSKDGKGVNDGTADAVFLLNDVQLTDTGAYVCEVTDGFGLVQSSSAQVRIVERASSGFHSADTSHDWSISVSELLRVIQLYNSDQYCCDPESEDGYTPGDGNRDCDNHNTDYYPKNWVINLSELLRIIQFFNMPGSAYHTAEDTGDRFAPGAG